MSRKYFQSLLVAAGFAVGVPAAIPDEAAQAQSVCPDFFQPTIAALSPQTDRNGNGVVCFKLKGGCQPGTKCGVFVDDKID